MDTYPELGTRIKWTNAPPLCVERGDEYGTFMYRDGEYHYCEMDGTKSTVELYLNEIEEE